MNGVSFHVPVTPTIPNPSMSCKIFQELGVPAALTGVLARRGVTTPLPIQARTIPDALAGRDVLGRARTGSGKTLAFGLPLLIRAAAAMGGGGTAARPSGSCSRPWALVLVPTRELARQVHDELAPRAGPLRLLAVYGGASTRTQVQALRRGVDVLVRRYLADPVRHAVSPATGGVARMDHRFVAVTALDKVAADLAARSGRVLLFVRTRHGAARLARQLGRGGVGAGALHGDMAQHARERALAAFAAGRAPVLVATDLAARGIHVDGVDLVVHFDPPAEHKAYLHRSGRTARAGAAGSVVTLVLPEQASEVIKLLRRAGVAPAGSPAATMPPDASATPAAHGKGAAPRQRRRRTRDHR
jgi:superfamily II DNA/RNA helicase